MLLYLLEKYLILQKNITFKQNLTTKNMKKIILIGVVALSGFLISCKPALNKAPEIPLEDFFRNPETSSYQISPNGEYISYMAPYETRMNVFVQKIGSDSATMVTKETARNVGGYFWGSDNRILFMKDTAGDENFQLYGVDIDGNNALPLTAFEGVLTTIIDDLPEQEDLVIIGMNKRNPQIFDPYRLNIKTGELTQLAENPGNIQGWMTDNEGKLRVAVALNGTDQTLLYRKDEKDPFQPMITTNFTESITPISFTEDNQKFYAVSNIGRDKAALIIYDPEKKAEEKLIYENNKYDVSNAYISRVDKKLKAASYTGHKGTTREFFDDDFKKMFDNISSKVKGMPFGMAGSNKSEDKIIIRTYNDRTPGAYYIYDVKTDSLGHIADVYPWLKEDDMGLVFPITYKTRDNFEIEGYLTLPNGYISVKEAKNLPVVVNPHGGPWARDTWGYNPEAQFLANRGYAVLQMNFRGSTGYGKNFWKASFKEWGKNMQNDITDGVEWLKKEGIADPEKIAIYGGSYGGYATLAGLTFTPDLYACGVDYVGVSNLFTFMNTIPPYWKPMLDMMYEMVGDPKVDSLALAETSPALHADKIVAPLFVAQGANDPRVNKAESDQMVEALKKRGIDVEYMVKDNEGHGFHNEENRFEFYKAMEAFLNKHLKTKE